MAVLFVIPLEKLLAEGAAVLDAAEAIRKLRTVLRRAELASRIGVVIRRVVPGIFSLVETVSESNNVQRNILIKLSITTIYLRSTQVVSAASTKNLSRYRELIGFEDCVERGETGKCQSTMN